MERDAAPSPCKRTAAARGFGPGRVVQRPAPARARRDAVTARWDGHDPRRKRPRAREPVGREVVARRLPRLTAPTAEGGKDSAAELLGDVRVGQELPAARPDEEPLIGHRPRREQPAAVGRPYDLSEAARRGEDAPGLRAQVVAVEEQDAPALDDRERV